MSKAPRSLRGEGRVFWNVDRAPADKPWPDYLPNYSGYLIVQGIRFKVEGWRGDNDAGRFVRLVVTSDPIDIGRWPKQE